MQKIIKKALTNFWRLHKIFVLKNAKLKNSHFGETCFIFGNGGSLKYYDISKLSDIPAIVCSYSLLDRRMQNLNVKYFMLTDSYMLYPFLYNTYPHVRKFQLNKVRPIFKELIANNKHVKIFTSLTNIYSSLCRYRNVNYVYHFGDKTSLSHDMAGNFSNCHGAIDIMLATAKYLGFSKAIVMGCDYLGVPTMLGHFYADYKPYSRPDVDLIDFRSRVKAAAEGIDVTVILPEGVTSPDFKFDSYENYFGLKKIYQKNSELIDIKYLEMLRAAEKSDQTIMSEVNE